MKRFRFKLDPVLRLRKIREEERLKELSEIVSQINQFQDFIRENADELERILSIHSGVDPRTASVSDFQGLQTYLRGLNLQNDRYQASIDSLQGELQKRREALIEAQKARKILERLKELRLEKYMRTYRKSERYMSEEHYTAQFIQETEENNYEDSQRKRVPRVFYYDFDYRDEREESDSELSAIRKFYESLKR